jgi:hypothetical protein
MVKQARLETDIIRAKIIIQVGSFSSPQATAQSLHSEHISTSYEGMVIWKT